MSDIAIKIEGLKKQYKLGAIGGQTLNAELQSWWARKRGKEDPNKKIGDDSFQYGKVFWALNGISLEIKKGEALGIIGGNGAGKSTLLKILSRVTAPTEGDIWIDGRVASMLEVGTGFHGELTGRENIYMNGAILGMTRKEVERKMDSIIHFSECRQFIDTPVKRYSSGMYVKLAFSVASHLDSEIMIMDEVLAVGDMNFQKKCLGKMGDEARGGKTVLYVSHNMSTIRNLCTRCIVLNKGKVIYDGDVEDAIDVYMESGRKELVADHDYTYFKRVPGIYGILGEKVHIDKVSFLDKSCAIFSKSELLRLEIHWRSLRVNKLKFGFSIKQLDDSSIGFVESDKVITTSADTKCITIFGIDLSYLVPGNYYAYLVAFYWSANGEYVEIDETDRIYFEILNEDNERKQWVTKFWGNIKLKEGEILNHEERQV